jgi:hypothetical protein
VLGHTRPIAEEIVRSPIASIERLRRGFEDRLFVAAPWLLRNLVALVMRRHAESRLRRAVLTRGQQIGWEAANRARPRSGRSSPR